MDNETLTTTWCRMWSEDPALAHRVMADGCVQWSGQTAALDTVTGPGEQEQFVTAYRAQHVNVFRPRVLADGGDRFGYLWDVRVPDGAVRTGLDVNVVRGGLVEENWTFVADRRCDHPDPDPDPEPAGEAELVDLAERWLRACSGLDGPDPDLLADDCPVFAGSPAESVDDLRGPVALAALVGRRPAGAVTGHREPVVDPGRGRVLFLRTGADGTGGVDLLTVRGGRIAQAWSLTGTRAFRY